MLGESDINESLIHLKSKIKDVSLSSLRFYNKKDQRFENLSEEEHEVFINLQSNKNMITQKADKCNSVVVIARLSYVNKMDKLLSHRSKFFKIDFNQKHKVNQDIRHFLDMEFEIKPCLDDIYNHNYLSKDDNKFLKPFGSNPGVMYGLCKVYKVSTDNDNVPPFHPILSAIGTCSYNLAKVFVPILKKLKFFLRFFFILKIKSLIKIQIFL